MKANISQSRRRLVVGAGALLSGALTALTLFRRRKVPEGKPAQVPVPDDLGSLAGRIRLPGDLGSLMRSFASDPDKVRRFRELTRWRQEHSQDSGISA